MLLDFGSNLSDRERSFIDETLKTLTLSYTVIELYGKNLLVTDVEPNQEQFDQLSVALRKGDLLTPKKNAFPLTSKNWKSQKTIVEVKKEFIGGSEKTIIAGPCAVENEEMLFETAAFLQEKGIKFIRGGAFKPRTSPYSFQGLGKTGLILLNAAAAKYDLRVVTEIMDISQLDMVLEYSDILQVGTRNMHNYSLLKELGKINKPIILKRGFASKIEEWLLAAEYVLLGGNGNVILCERGIRTFDDSIRNVLDISAIPRIKSLSHLPIIIDPSQGTGQANLVETLTLAGLIAGADGALIEIHPNPRNAMSDGEQSLNFEQFSGLFNKILELSNFLNTNLNFQHNNSNFVTNKLG